MAIKDVRTIAGGWSFVTRMRDKEADARVLGNTAKLKAAPACDELRLESHYLECSDLPGFADAAEREKGILQI